MNHQRGEGEGEVMEVMAASGASGVESGRGGEELYPRSRRRPRPIQRVRWDQSHQRETGAEAEAEARAGAE